MSDRYEILDILSQDADGIVFHAEDRKTGGEVALRRFFPFGADGGGLEDEEKAAYEIAVQRLMGISHPALRNVLDGGTDPIDGMPFLVTEWIEGAPLSERLAERPLSPPSAKALLDLALETCQVLSQTFQEECVWIETSTDSILLGPSGRERQVTFRMSPLRWLNDDARREGLRPLLHLAEESTGWNRRMLSDNAGEGLGGWIKTLRKDPQQWSLEQARYALHHGADAIVKAPTSALPSSAPISPAHATIPAQIPAPEFRPRHSVLWWPWAVAGGMAALLVAGFFVWQRVKPEAPAAPPVAAAEKPAPAVQAATPATSAAEVPAMSAAELASARAAQLAAERAKDPTIPSSDGSGWVHPELNRQLIDVGRQLREHMGETRGVSGKLHEVRASNSGKTLYLEFGDSASPDAICIRYRTKAGVFTEEELRGYVGKNIRVTGTVVNDPSGRIAIDLASKDALELVDA